MPKSFKKSSEIRSDRKSALIGTLAGWMMKLIFMTLRMEIRDFCGIGSPYSKTPPVIYILWHNRFLIVPPAWKKLCSNHRQAVTLTSASHDGDMVARAMAVFGLGAVRGSSSRRAVAALVGLKHSLLEGMDVCLTPDGPRGPRYRMQSGIIKLAEATGAPIVPVHVRFSAAWRLKTWDRFVIPKPFSRVQVTFAESLSVPKQMDPETFEAHRQQIEAILINGTDDA